MQIAWADPKQVNLWSTVQTNPLFVQQYQCKPREMDDTNLFDGVTLVLHHCKSHSVDTHPISLYTKAQLILRFTDISKHQTPYHWLTRTNLTSIILFPNRLHTCERITDSAQPHSWSLSWSTWSYMLPSSTPYCITPFWLNSDWIPF